VEPERKGRFMTRLWRVVAVLLLLLALLVSQSILTSRRQHEEQAVVETYSVARVLDSDLGNLVDKVKLALHAVATERERALYRPHGDEAADRSFIANVHANLPDALAIRVADAAGRVIYQAEFSDAPAPGRTSCAFATSISPAS
jgi:hypothetical protein